MKSLAKSFAISGARGLSSLGLLTLLISFQAFAYAQTDNSTPAGRWYMNAQTDRTIFQFERVSGVWRGASVDDQGKTLERLESITWDKATRTLEFCRIGSGFWQWYRGSVVEGVFVARFTHSGKTDAKPVDPLAFKWKATGWNYDYLTPAQGPLVFDLYVNETKYRARLRLDRAADKPNAGFAGRLKFYAWDNSCSEVLENDVIIEQWDGVNLRFRAVDVGAILNLSMVFTGKVSGRLLEGRLLQTDPDGKQFTRTISGARAEILSYGFSGKTASARSEWQARTRRRLEHLMMASYPAPLKTEVSILRDNLPPVLGLPFATRDDDPNAFPQNYRLSEFTLKHTLANPMANPLTNPLNGTPLTREAHGFFAKPSSGITGATRSMGRRPLVIAINGHSGSAYQTFDPSSLYWYGDAFARQGYAVMAIDISHRPVADLVASGLSSNAMMLGYFNGFFALGDDVKNGNRPHSSIKPSLPAATSNPELYTDWEENGERLWDLRRALDYAISRPDVDPTRIIVVGLSLGGELAAWLGALDPRVTVTIAAGYSPDLSVLKFRGSHGCWNWHYADIREYMDSSELFALVAPRALLIETGKRDSVYHCYRRQYASDKQIARRVRTAYFDAPNNFVHYLHSDYHIFRAGGPHATLPERYVRVPLAIAPNQPGDQLWQSDEATWSPKAWTVFNYVASWMNFRTLW